jgi:hypothetical protein
LRGLVEKFLESTRLAHEYHFAIDFPFVGPAVGDVARQPNAATAGQMMLLATDLKYELAG